MIEVHHRACHLREAICGLKIETRGPQILSIKGDPDDPLSRGHICPKAVALKGLHEDPDRLRYPVKRIDGPDGPTWEQIDWDEALDMTADDAAICYGRMGVSTQRFGALCQWLIQIINIATGSLDRAGGSMFTLPAADQVPRTGAGGDRAELRSASGSVTVTVLARDEVMPGVVSLPHGFGHHREGIRLHIAEAHAGVSCNDVTGSAHLDELSGNAAVNGVPVTLAPTG